MGNLTGWTQTWWFVSLIINNPMKMASNARAHRFCKANNVGSKDFRKLWPFKVFWGLGQFIIKSGNGKTAKLNGSEIIHISKLQNLKVANINGFTWLKVTDTQIYYKANDHWINSLGRALSLVIGSLGRSLSVTGLYGLCMGWFFCWTLKWQDFNIAGIWKICYKHYI